MSTTAATAATVIAQSITVEETKKAYAKQRMMSTDMFDEFVRESLRYQMEHLDYSMYHLDGPGAIKRLDSLMSLERLNALQ